MQALYITSTTPTSGKTALCYGLAARMRQDGLRVGYFQPLVILKQDGSGDAISKDASFMRAALNLKESQEVLSPVIIDAAGLEKALGGQPSNYAERIEQAFVEVAKDKDVLLIEGAATLNEGLLLDLPPQALAARFNTRVLVVIKYSDELALDGLLAAKVQFGASLLGAVLNEVPLPNLQFVEHSVVPFLLSRRVPVYATLPRERLLMALTVNEIAEFLGAEILNSPEQGDQLVENFLVGAMSVDAALSYFRRQPHKAVITGGDRSDIQLAALETSTRCIVLTGNIPPGAVILSRAEELAVPLLLAKQDTLSVVEILEQYFGRIHFHQPHKVAFFQELLAKYFDFPRFYADLKINQE
ncbi:MAG: phosphotransacetylase family protein [Deltaproteobacteria bacterium]|nr:phosphotransacetylase family protein [Deltaproteobacteria bacterium]